MALDLDRGFRGWRPEAFGQAQALRGVLQSDDAYDVIVMAWKDRHPRVPQGRENGIHEGALAAKLIDMNISAENKPAILRTCAEKD